MWRPAPMQQISLLVLNDELLPALQGLGELGVFQAVDSSSLRKWPEGVSRLDVGSLLTTYDRLNDRLARITGTLGLEITQEELKSSVLEPESVAADVGAQIGKLDEEIQRLLDERAAALDKLERLETLVLQLQVLVPLDVDLSTLRGLRFLYFTAGLLPMENLPRLEESLSDVPHVLLRLGRDERRWRVFVFAPRSYQHVIDAALRGAFLERVEIPPEISGPPSVALEQVLEQRRQLLAETESIQEALAQIAQRQRAQIVELTSSIAANRAAVYALRSCLTTQHVKVMVGWVPKSEREELVTDLRDRISTVATYAEDAPGPTGGTDTTTVPTRLANPSWLRPFETLIRTYGLPTYWEVDPTPLAACLFLLMFGVMFGDVGQGAVLALLGLAIQRWNFLRGFRSLGPILIGCGIAAMVFGLIYGSVFGAEGLIPALGVRPLDRITLLLGASVFYGAILISTGVVLNIVNARLQRNLRHLLFAPYGLAGLAFYWIALGLSISTLLGRSVSLVVGVLLLAVPLLVIFLHEPLSNLLRGAPAYPKEGPVYFLQSGVEVFDVAVRYLSNTLSFVRIAAFAITHVGLGLTVFTLAAMLNNVPLGGPLVVILGNALIIGLEGLIVGIQVLRLEYYEFFGKFFRGGGLPYQPFVLPGFTRAVQR